MIRICQICGCARKTFIYTDAMDAMEKALGEWTEFFASKKKNSIFALRNSVTIATISEKTMGDYEEN